MPREIQTQVSPEVAHNESLLNEHVAKLFHVSVNEIQKVMVVKRSIDARQKAIKFNIKGTVFLKESHLLPKKSNFPSIKMLVIRKKSLWSALVQPDFLQHCSL